MIKSLIYQILIEDLLSARYCFPDGSDGKKKNLPAMQETQVQCLGWGDSLEKEMATHFQYSCLENLMDGGAW